MHCPSLCQNPLGRLTAIVGWIKLTPLLLAARAVNCRLYSEDPWSDFRGHAEIIDKYEEPREGNIIIDSCLRLGYSIPLEYDPLVATFTVFGSNRYESCQDD